MAVDTGVQSPTFFDMPDVETFIVETVDRRALWRQGGRTRDRCCRWPPAVSSAVYDALGVWIDEVPVTPEKIIEALRRGKGRPARFRPPAIPPHPYPPAIKVEPPNKELDRAGLPRLSTYVRRLRGRRRACPRTLDRRRCVAGGTDLFPKLKRPAVEIDT